MVEVQSFKELTDRIKNTKKITIEKMAAAIGVKKHILDNIRRGSQLPSVFVLKALADKYPEFIDELVPKIPKSDVVEEPQTGYARSRNHLEDLAKTQAKLIAMMEGELEKMRIENRKLREKIRNLQQG